MVGPSVTEGVTRAPLSLARSIAFVARQPIFDRDRRLVGYELLDREPAPASAPSTPPSFDGKGDEGLTSVLDRLSGSKQAWANLPRDLLQNPDLEVFDPRRCFIELLEAFEPDPRSSTPVVRRSGSFTLVPPPNEEHDPLVKLAHVVKLRVRDVPNDRVAAAVARLRPFGVRLLADQVENRASFDICRRLGFNYFQGFHFTRPETVERRELPPEMVRIARLMTLAVDMGVRDAELEEELRKDPGLAFKLLRMVNAAASGGRGIESILHAIRLVGRSSLHRWLSLLFASSSPRITEDEREMILLSLERARFCELIAIEAEHDYAAGSAFLTGLLSSFDAVLGLPMKGVLDQIGVAEDVRYALLGQPGPFTNYLQLATAYAGAEWDTVIDLSNGLGAVKQELPRLYSSAGRWARTAMVKS